MPEAFHRLLKSKLEIQEILRERREGSRKGPEGKGIRQRGRLSRER